MTTHQSSKSTRPPLKDVPDVVFDSIAKTYYSKGKFLGKGGFARCYELIDPNTNRIYAGKVVSKTLLVKKHQKDKVCTCTYIQILYNPNKTTGSYSSCSITPTKYQFSPFVFSNAK